MKRDCDAISKLLIHPPYTSLLEDDEIFNAVKEHMWEGWHFIICYTLIFKLFSPLTEQEELLLKMDIVRHI